MVANCPATTNMADWNDSWFGQDSFSSKDTRLMGDVVILK